MSVTGCASLPLYGSHPTLWGVCTFMTLTGVTMLLVGSGLILWFFRKTKRHNPETSPPRQVEWMVVGALMVSIGLLLAVLGTVGGTCQGFGLT